MTATFGAHVRSDPNPLAIAAEWDASIIQMFVTDPQEWNRPEPHPQAAALRASDVAVVVHSSYVINVASTNNRLRMPSRKAVSEQAAAAAELGAIGLVVHGGHLREGEDPAKGIENWRKLFERQADGFGVPIFIENAAGGGRGASMTDTFDAFARLWDSVGEFEQAGVCLDTCHAWAAGEDLLGIVDRLVAITGRLDLIHLNNSHDPAGSGRDHHQNLATGTIDPELLLDVARDAVALDVPVILETPAAGVPGDLDLLRSECN